MKLRAAFLILVVATGLYAPGCTTPDVTTPTVETGRPVAERLIGVPGLDNFARVSSTLYRGAQPTPEGYRQLKQLGVKTVINLRHLHSSKADIEAAGMTCIELPLSADLFGSEPPTDEKIQKFFDVVLDPARQPVYIHCMAGKDRTGTMAALYRIEIDGWSPEEAAEEMRLFGFHTYYRDLARFVAAYRSRGIGAPR